jgi:hypothetical protein
LIECAAREGQIGNVLEDVLPAQDWQRTAVTDSGVACRTDDGKASCKSCWFAFGMPSLLASLSLD